MITENYAITFDPDEWVKELGETTKRTGLDDHGRGRLDAQGFRERVHDAPYGVA